MANNLYEEAINAAEQIKEAAESKVKQQLVEAMSPKIKTLIERSLMGEEIEEIENSGFFLTPGRYVGAPKDDDDNETFDEKMKRITSLLKEQQEEGSKLDHQIAENLKRIGYEF